MIMKQTHLLFLFLIFFLFSCKETPDIKPLVNTYIEKVSVNDREITQNGTIHNVNTDSVVVRIWFSSKIEKEKYDPLKIFVSNGVDADISVLNDTLSRVFSFRINKKLDKFSSYTLYAAEGEHLGVKLIDTYQFTFITELDSTYKFPVVSDDSLLTLVQKQTFRYFWDYAHPVSGLARERLGSGETVTSGGSGFGIMTIPIAIERGFITREQGFERMNTIVNFLNTKAERFHGVFPHWLNGTTGKTQAFSTKDNGADLVETAFLMQGLLTVQQYFKNGTTAERAMCDTIQKIWEEVEWTWFQRDGQQKLFWHWSPNYNWDMNMAVSGWNEGLIVYVLAASSPTYAISKSVYDEGWARNGAMRNGKTFFDIPLPLGEDRGGPMFFAHYSFMGLDPRGLSDAYANYWEQNTAHAQINYRYCVANPRNHFGYSADSWGLTASDIPSGYTASSPNNDGGTIAPTAALASFPYTPDESMRALRYFYYVLGDKLWGEYGFRDAFNLSKRWFAPSFLAIDQGPIVVMIENHRTGLPWQLFMQNENVKSGLEKLGFTKE